MPTHRKLPALGALRAFEATARHLSMRRAADELSVTPTAISHQIRQLEATLGVALFERRVRALRLTPQGQALYPVLRDGFDAFEQTIGQIRQTNPRGIVTVTSTAALTAHWLTPAAPAFQADNPELDLKLHASDALVRLPDDADVAVRYGTGDWPGLVCEPLFDDGFAPVCSPALGIRHYADLAGRPLLHSGWQPGVRDPATWTAWAHAAGLVDTLDTAAGPTFSDETHALNAALQGQGVAMANLPLVERELASGALVAPFGPVLRRYRFHLAYPASRQDDPAVVAACAWIRRIAPPACPPLPPEA